MDDATHLALAGVLDDVARALAAQDAAGWLVGGCLRDGLLGLPVTDVDLAVTGDPHTLANVLRQHHPITIAPLSHSVRIGLHAAGHATPLQLDISPLAGATIEADLERRDFRINALALPLAARAQFLALLAAARIAPCPNDVRVVRAILPDLIDPIHGLGDLQQRTITPASAHALRDDPGRILRAARLVARLRFAAAPPLLHLASEAAPLLSDLSPDRLRDELSALLGLPRAATALHVLATAGALATLFPAIAARRAIPHAVAAVGTTASLQGDLGGTTMSGYATLADLEALRAWYATPLPDGLPRIVALRWGLLLSTVISDGAWPSPEPLLPEMTPPAQPLSQRLLAAPEKRIVRAIAEYLPLAATLLYASESDERALRHLFAAAGDAAIDVLTATAACAMAQATAELLPRDDAEAVTIKARTVLAAFFRDRERLMPPPLLSGVDLIRKLSVPAGPEIGSLLAEVRRAQLDGAITTRADALALVRTLIRAK